MICCPYLRRFLAVLAAGAVSAAVFLAVSCSGNVAPTQAPAGSEKADKGDKATDKGDKGKEASRDWPMFGGQLQRNRVNTTAKDVPTDWDIKSGKNVKWVAELGSKAYGGPVIYKGKVFIGTNNDRPRNPRDTDKDKLPVDKG